ncbi:MAG TPA: hypothetical protein VF331_06875 [Polyangiales bacterium]
MIVWQRCVASAESAPELASEWVERALTRVEVATGQVLAGIGATLVAAFDSTELVDAVELARTLVDDAARTDGALKVDVGIALGEVEQVVSDGNSPTYRGAVIDRAQVLANRARAGEVVLDEAAVNASSETFLFARELAAGGVRGRALDPTHPRKRECRRALGQLKPAPIAPSVLPVFEALRAAVNETRPARVVIHSQVPSPPLDLIDRLALTLTPALRLRVSRKAGGLQPLGGLELALRRLWPEDSELDGAGLPPALRAKLKVLLRGQGVQRAEMVETLCELVRSSAADGGRPWIVLDQLQEIDPATLGVVAEVAAVPDLPLVLLMTLPLDASVPAALLHGDATHEFAIPTLKLVDRRHIAEAMLSLEEGSEVGQRVALLGGDSALGVLEAARTLVSAGDLVLRGKSFAWRTGPRGGTTAVPVEALITERALGLPPDAYRVLEALCVAPADVSREILERVLARDGVDQHALGAGLAQLMDEGFVDDGLSLGSADATIRSAVRNSMPPARAAELHRFVAEVLQEKQKAPGFGSAQLAYHLAEGGLEADAARALIDAAKVAADCNFGRVALRLLATAVELDGSAEIRKAASAAAKAIEAAQPPAAVPEHAATKHAAQSGTGERKPRASMSTDAIAWAVHALVQRDYEAVERWLDTATAAGWGRSAVQRILALAQLARGDSQEATLTLSRASAPDAPAAVQARDALCWALIHVEAGDPIHGVRDALAALARSRRLADPAGERAALHVLAHCYRQLQREPDAARIDAAAP